MPASETSFDTNQHHIHIEITVINPRGIEYSVDAILDTGAPKTEFSDQFLSFTGFIYPIKNELEIEHGLQTQKYDRTTISLVKICGHTIANYEVYVSRFQESWGIDALIGLDFFRKFRVEIDYSRGVLISELL